MSSPCYINHQTPEPNLPGCDCPFSRRLQLHTVVRSSESYEYIVYWKCFCYLDVTCVSCFVATAVAAAVARVAMDKTSVLTMVKAKI